MPSFARAILLALHVSLFLALTGFSPETISALASPLPDHSPAVSANSPSSLLAVRVVNKHSDAELAARTPAVPPAASLQQQRQYERLSQSADGAQTAANNMKVLAAQSKTVDPSDVVFQQNCAHTLDQYRESFGQFETTIVSDKGLGYYDQGGLQTLVKDLINANKVVLDAIYELVASIPIIGPLLAPIVYQIKCIVDAILDFTEDLTDATLDALRLLLNELGLGAINDLLDSLNLGL
ncbi:hypothetical protein DFH07DRAFT_789163 [Mycena maculata]|uniref:Uncharacterized protein n=1 Tax=Mycena maculata TaxID=230809 RepID=A0AAD7P1A9_9AGAR|nr:hypothetical protein DFH07DRAFT_789163 [Mycena maculata]